MPRSDKSTRDEQGRRTCPYCGYPLGDNRRSACPAHSDLPRLEHLDDRWMLMRPLDDRYTLTEDAKS